MPKNHNEVVTVINGEEWTPSKLAEKIDIPQPVASSRLFHFRKGRTSAKSVFRPYSPVSMDYETKEEKKRVGKLLAEFREQTKNDDRIYELYG
jgi:hypothetical protein